MAAAAGVSEGVNLGLSQRQQQVGSRPPPPPAPAGHAAASSSSTVPEGLGPKAMTVVSSPEMQRWALPAAAMLGGLFLQNVGLYLGTKTYVHWMDEVHRPFASIGSAESFAAVAEGQLWPHADNSFSFGEFLTEFLTDLLPVAWLAFVVQKGNLHAWSKTLLTGALLSCLKGFIAWATVMPDLQGWEACRNRLGADGLKFYRVEVGSSAGLITDLLLLEVRHAWLGSESSNRFCADTTICSNTMWTILFSISLWEVLPVPSLRLDAEGFPGIVRFLQTHWYTVACRSARWMLGLLVLANIACPVLHRYHRLADVILAVILTLGVYSSPALALAVHFWCKGFVVSEDSLEVGLPARPGAASETGSTPTSFVALLQGDARFAESEDGDSEDRAFQEFGQVGIPPLPGRYYLRKEAVKMNLGEGNEDLQEQLETMKAYQDQHKKRVQKKVALLKKEMGDELLGAARSAAFFEQRLQEASINQSRMLAARDRRERGEMSPMIG
eukprot:TRINITY_DN65269_c0_g1_i1.p1 TRINITY_DN65269_c0_g1~~TRINITY_DN65269_c0_g1_i1.p1  ORF type:complete len:499 (+),score=83.31 TRINITY_DN65269_c0_g1_i1:32-1528(+)